MSTRRRIAIAIVGGGASGVGLAASMVEYLPVGLSTVNLSITLFDACGFHGGNAYAPDTSRNLMNTTCGAIDRGFGGEFGFLRWVEGNTDKWRPLLNERTLDTDNYAPRQVVGLYLSDLLAHTQRKAADREWCLETIKEEVVDIEPPATPKHDYVLHTASGARYQARYVYLALGHLQRLKTENDHYADRYYHSPYPIDRLIEEIPRTARVGVIGTRLSAIDVAIGLASAGHKGGVVCVSRGGRLPAVRADQGKYEFRKLERAQLEQELRGRKSMLRLVDVASMLGSEIEHAEGRHVGLDDIVNENAGPVDYYEREVALAKGRTRPWQSVLYATNRNIDLLWHHLADDDKQLLMSKWLNDWLTYRASIPRENAERILALMKAGRLQVCGGARNFRFDHQSGDFSISFDTGDAISVQYVVSAIGSAGRIEDADSTLIRKLLDRGLVNPHRFGGVDCRFENGQVNPAPGAVPVESRMFAIGPITSGVYFFTTALEIIWRQAVQRTQDLAFLLGIEWLDLPETEAWVDAKQQPPADPSGAPKYVQADGPVLLERLVVSDQLDLIDFEQLRLLNDQVTVEELQAADGEITG